MLVGSFKVGPPLAVPMRYWNLEWEGVHALGDIFFIIAYPHSGLF